MPRRLGQHFLKNKLVLKKIVETLELCNDDFVIEIGPGHGELTQEIKNQNAKVKIIAIELDKNLIHFLEDKFSGSTYAEIIEGNALKVLPELLNRSLLVGNHYKIVGNIPYYITGHLLRIIGELEEAPSKTVLLIQKEVAQRICANAPHSNLLSLSVQFWSEPKIITFVPASDFSPPPKVGSAVIELKTRLKTETSESLRDKYYSFLKAAFKQPRKTLLNNLVFTGWEKSRATLVVRDMGLQMNARPQELSVRAVEQMLLCDSKFSVV